MILYLESDRRYPKHALTYYTRFEYIELIYIETNHMNEYGRSVK